MKYRLIGLCSILFVMACHESNSIKVTKLSDISTRYKIYTDTSLISYFSISEDTSLISAYDKNGEIIELFGIVHARDSERNFRLFIRRDTNGQDVTIYHRKYVLSDSNKYCILNKDTCIPNISVFKEKRP